MPKAKNTKQIATFAQRQYAAAIASARTRKKEWATYEASAKEALVDSLDGKVDITLVTTTDDEVLSITESDPKTDSVDWPAFQAAHPELNEEFKKFYKPATTSVTILTKWVEQPPQIPTVAPGAEPEEESEAS